MIYPRSLGTVTETLINAYRRASNTSPRLREYQPMDVTGDYTAQNLSAPQRDVIQLIWLVPATLVGNLIFSLFNFLTGERKG
jgi:hypothetical protein